MDAVGDTEDVQRRGGGTGIQATYSLKSA
jgi:hypothetical protein